MLLRNNDTESKQVKLYLNHPDSDTSFYSEYCLVRVAILYW